MAEQTEKTYLTNRSLPSNSLVYEVALQRDMEKEEIRQKILRQKELEEEVWRELAMERAFGTTQRSLVDDQIGALQPSLIMAPPEIKHSTQIRDKDKVILFAKPDIGLYSAKRKAVTQDVPGDEPSAISLNKNLKEEWSCELCRIKATSENGLNDHLNGKKHKAKEARLKKEIDKHNKKSQNTVIKVTDTAVNIRISEVDADKDQKTSKCCIALEVMNENVVDTKSKNEKKLEEMTVDERVTESKNEEQLLETVLDNGASVAESKNEKKLEEMSVDERVTESKNEEQLSETALDNGASVTESKDEKKLEEMTVDERVTESKNEEQHVEKNQNVDFFESIKGAATEEAGKSAFTEMMKVRGLWCEVCQIGTNSQVVMEGHIKGKKHIKKMNQFNKKNVSLSSTSFVSPPHATWLIEDTTNGVKKETDQMMTHMTNTRDGI